MNLFDSNIFCKATSSRTPTWFWKGTEPLLLNNEIIKSLESFSDNSNTNCRICFHTNPEELCHVMLIVERKGMNIPPHWHENKSDFVFILKGEMEFFIFSKDMKEDKKVTLSQGNGYKSPASSIHAIGIKSEKCIYIETSTGPFNPNNDAIFPKWAHEWHGNYNKN